MVNEGKDRIDLALNGVYKRVLEVCLKSPKIKMVLMDLGCFKSYYRTTVHLRPSSMIDTQDRTGTQGLINLQCGLEEAIKREIEASQLKQDGTVDGSGGKETRKEETSKESRMNNFSSRGQYKPHLTLGQHGPNTNIKVVKDLWRRAEDLVDKNSGVRVASPMELSIDRIQIMYKEEAFEGPRFVWKGVNLAQVDRK